MIVILDGKEAGCADRIACGRKQLALTTQSYVEEHHGISILADARDFGHGFYSLGFKSEAARRFSDSESRSNKVRCRSEKVKTMERAIPEIVSRKR